MGSEAIVYDRRGSIAPGALNGVRSFGVVPKSGRRGVIAARDCSAARVPGDVVDVGDDGVDDKYGAIGNQGLCLRARRSSLIVLATRDADGSWSTECRRGGGNCGSEVGVCISEPLRLSNDGYV